VLLAGSADLWKERAGEKPALPPENNMVYAPTYAAMEGIDARDLYEKYKANINEEIKTNMAKEWFGTIIGFPWPGSRMAITWRLDREATAAYKEGRYEEALDRFCHWLAVVDTDPSTGACSEMRATLTSNVAACLAALGLLQNAIDFYERSVQEFKGLPFSVIRDVNLSRVVYGKLMDKRVQYIEAKLVDLRAGKTPPVDSYQDGYGVTRQWSPEEMEGKPAPFSWSNPLTWVTYPLSRMSSRYNRMGEERTIASDAPRSDDPRHEII